MTTKNDENLKQRTSAPNSKSKMADGGSTQVFRYLFSSVRYDIGSAGNAISTQIRQPLALIITRKETQTQ